MGGNFGRINSLEQAGVVSVVSLHPESLASAEGRDGLDFSLQTGIPATSQLWLSRYFKDEDADALPEQFRPERLWKDESWSYPDGSPLESPDGILAEKFDGTHHEYARGLIPSVFAPGFLDLITTEARGKFEQGYTGVQFGNIRAPRKSGLDFSVWAQATFREHLKALPDERLDELGIQSPGSFDIRDHLEQENLQPATSAHPAEDPVFREYLLHHHMGIKDFLFDLKKWVSETFPDRTPPFYMDQPIGDPRLSEVPVAETYLSEVVDFVSAEDFRTMPAVDLGLGRTHGRTVPEQDIRDYIYKLLLATVRYEKPVYTWDVFGGEYYSDIEQDDELPMLLRLQTAEAYAMDGRRRLTLRDAPLTWKEEDGQVPRKLQHFIDFLWAHQRFLQDVEPDNTVGVVWSVPTLLWNTIPQWHIESNNHTHSFIGIVTLLRESQIPYDVVVFGHPDLWPDAENLDELPGYDAIVLPAVESITQAQRAALEEYLVEDGVVISSGSSPERTGTFERNVDGFDIFEQDNVIVLDSNPGKRRLGDRSQGGTLITTLNETGVEPNIEEPDTSLGINHLIQQDSSRHIIHLLNYDYDPEVDDFSRKHDIEIQLTGVDAKFEFGRYYSPQLITDLTVTRRNGRHEVTIPELVEWGFIALAPTEEHLEDHESEQKARDRISEARVRLQKAREGKSGWSVDLTIADVELQSAEIALAYDAYSLAAEVANSVIERAEPSMTPTKSPEPSATPSPAVSPKPIPAETSEMSERTVKTESVAQPGFGFMSALLGLGGLSFLVHRWLNKRNDDE